MGTNFRKNVTFIRMAAMTGSSAGCNRTPPPYTQANRKTDSTPFPQLGQDFPHELFLRPAPKLLDSWRLSDSPPAFLRALGNLEAQGTSAIDRTLD